MAGGRERRARAGRTGASRRAVPAAATSTRDVILDAAERRFAEHGFAGVSVRDLAAEAGLKNQASLYHHFRDKRALYEAVLVRGLEPVLALIAASAAAGGPARGGWEAFVDRLVVYLAEHPNLPRLVQRAALEDRRYLPSAVPRLLQPLFDRGVEVLAAGDAGWQRADLPHLAAALYHLIFGYFADAAMLAVVLREDPCSAAAVRRQRRFIRDALRRLLAPPPRAAAR
jgi:AcrR family transcriptional regulator